MLENLNNSNFCLLMYTLIVLTFNSFIVLVLRYITFFNLQGDTFHGKFLNFKSDFVLSKQFDSNLKYVTLRCNESNQNINY